MKIIPYQKLEFKLPMPPEMFRSSVMHELAKGHRKDKRYAGMQEFFLRGWISENAFEFYRHLSDLKYASIVMKGEVIKTDDNSATHIKMEIMFKPAVKLFFFVWFGLLSVFFALSVIYSLVNWQFNSGIPITVAMYLFASILLRLFFNVEVNDIKRYFSKTWFVNFE